jgi:ectoine hydroxylase-related dioxygenase (phytanoyl-CoA dioxygenase family)
MEFSDAHKDEFDKHGCVILKNVINAEQASDLKTIVQKLADLEKQHGASYFYEFDKSGKTQRVWNLVNKHEKFRQLLETSVIDQFMNYIFDRDTRHQKYFLSSFQANILYSDAARQKLHIDTPFPEPLPPWPAKANSIWFLDDFTEENGATEYFPGSHKFSHKPQKLDDENCSLKKACGPAGSVLITHGNLWHRAGANSTSKSRTALLCSFAASYAREIANEEDHSIVLSKDVVDNFSPHLSTILGIGHGIKSGSQFDHNKLKQ